MNRQQYLQELQSALHRGKVQDIEDILGEYEQHFARKMADGFTEEEIANKLEKPAAIAEQFQAAERSGTAKKSGGRAILGLGLGFAHFFVAMGFLLLFSGVLVLGVFALASFTLGGCLVLGTNIAGWIPPMPYFGALILGLSTLALGVLGSVGTINLYLYTRQWMRAYARWTKNTMNGGMYPPLSKIPQVSGRLRRTLRNTTMISLAVFIILAAAGCIALTVYVGFKPFWHELGWFGYTG